MSDPGDPESAEERRAALNARLREEAISRLPQRHQGTQLLEAVRLGLAAFGTESSGIDPLSLRRLSESLSELEAMPGSLYQAVTLAVATIRWASRETGRDEDWILEELAKNYDR